MPNIRQPLEIDEETADRDREKKEKERRYADDRRNAKVSDIQEGDRVLAKRMIKANKLSSAFEPDEYKVLEKRGSEAVIEAVDSGKKFRRNVSHLQKIIADDKDNAQAPGAVDERPTAAVVSPASNMGEAPEKKRTLRPRLPKNYAV